MSRVVRHVRALLQVPAINRLLFYLRFLYYVRLQRRLVVHKDPSATYDPEYSRRMLLRGQTSDRPLSLIRPLSVIPGVVTRRVLSVGTRYETELLYLVGYGFEADRVRGLDLFSYSPWIDAGNMHSMPYSDNDFDVVILGWILPYSEEPRRLAAETVRVLSDGGLVAVGMSYYSPQYLAERAARGETVIGEVAARIQTTERILELFQPHVDRVIFRFDPPPDTPTSRCLVVFSIKKK
jgi:hypothetical protein